ncbi:Clp protease ClpP [Levilactobacillus brevis]|uniref:ATP-dependent Clp protease proteolytic subunit n=1 Tax=Levilactobacillus brevis TaxID=1580 RepID=A0A0C1Q7S4_LEVBR|nr:head maturation protease, ClpP-related [Levilactobacillus brevis]ATU71373.1 Clp protease ClpP [Levilactobacillus brevis]KID43908.1 Prophage Clp protease-like protein [Levilactobacillus brevis]ODP93275.1 Clp protease ClpP [Levilactobacillus brevis]PBQ24089.1 Clp protease ClpP [Levilactobacillus brevis]
MTLPKYLTIKQLAPQTADMYIDGEIVSDEFYDSDTSAAGFRDALKQAGNVKTINLHINSPGGSVFEGIAITNMLKQNNAKVNVYVDGLAASIASVIAMSGDTIFMPKNAMMMIHNPWTMAVGNATELRKQADDLDQITKSSVQTYLEKAGDKLDEATLKQLMDDETWLTADESVGYGLADEVLEANQVAAAIKSDLMEKYHHVPKQLNTEKTVDSGFRRELLEKSKEKNNFITQTLGGF